MGPAGIEVVRMAGEPMASDSPGRPGEEAARRESQRIVVGVDGSAGARAALVWSLAAAARSGAVVEVVSAFPVDDYWTEVHLLDSAHVEAIRSDTETRAQALLAEALSDPASTAVPGVHAVPVDVLVVSGAPAEHLVHRASGAQLLVVGSRGRGSVRSALLGSVALHCSAHAPCSVVVVHPPVQPTAPRVVVGIDGSARSRAALARAAEAAAQIGAELDVVAVCQPVTSWSDLAIVARPFEETLPEARQRTAAIVVATLGAAPRPDVHVTVEVGAVGDVLVRKAEGAALLVVGSRSHSRLLGMVLGSVALNCVVHASCPVMVVRPDQAEVASAEPARALC